MGVGRAHKRGSSLSVFQLLTNKQMKKLSVRLYCPLGILVNQIYIVFNLEVPKLQYFN